MKRLLLGGLVLALSATGCSGPRSGTSVINSLGGCAASIPAARAAVHGRGTLVVVQRLKQSQADRVAREVTRLSQPGASRTPGGGLGPTPAPSVAGPPPHPSPSATPRAATGATALPDARRTPRSRPANPRDCLIVWRGPYAVGAVVPSEGRLSGTYALVFVSVRHPKVRLLLLTEQLPRQLHG